MNEKTQQLVGIGNEIISFLNKSDIQDANNSKRTYSIYAGLHSGNKEDYTTFKMNLGKIRDYFREILAKPEMANLVDTLDTQTQARIRNFVSEKDYFLDPIMLNTNDPDIKASQEARHNKLLESIKKLKPTEQEILWEQRVAGSIAYESDRSRIVSFLRMALKELVPKEEEFKDQKIKFFPSTGRIMVKGEYLNDSLKLNQRPYKLFQILYDNLDQRVDNVDIKTHIKKGVISKTADDYVSDILVLLPTDIRALIVAANRGYMIDSSRI